jgi:hypothetical protein
MKKRCILLLLSVFTFVSAEEEILLNNSSGLNVSAEEERSEELRTDLMSLAALLDSIRSREAEQEALHERLQAARDEIQRAAIRRELEETLEALESLRNQFRQIALSTDVSMFDKTVEEAFDWQREVLQFMRPIINEMKRLTEESRELAELESRAEELTRRRNAARRAVENIDRLLEAEPDETLEERLKTMRRTWTNREREAANQLTAVTNQLEQRQAARETPIGRTRGAAANFVRTRGRNLFLGIMAFVIVFFSMSWINKLFWKLYPVRKQDRTMVTRLITVIWTVLGTVLAMGATLAMFNLVGDIFLLSLTIIFLVGLCWAGMKTLPQFVEQFRMMLNMGAVKENERLVLDDIPWKVDSISFRTRLINPELDGGELVLPTRMLVGLHSRPHGKKEEWFPSRQGDWVLLSDSTYGRVSYQTPSAVQIVEPGGSQKVIPTPQFMALAPIVLSTGFRREMVFGLDYGLQSLAAKEIPQKMTAHVEAVLRERLGKALQHVRVDFSQAAGSSLDFTIVVDCGPDAGEKWWWIPRWTQTALLDLSNRENWTIPFPQLRIHNAK